MLSNEAFESTGSFKTDYEEQCRRLNSKPMNIRKVCPKSLPLLPNNPAYFTPSPVPATTQTTTPSGQKSKREATPSGQEKNVSRSNYGSKIVLNANQAMGSTLLTATSNMNIQASVADQASTDVVKIQPPPRPLPRHFLTPTITLVTMETADDSNTKPNQPTTDESDEDVVKLEIKGWNIIPGTLEALSPILGSYASITTLNFWNCGLVEAHASLLYQHILINQNIRTLQLDLNPSIPETYFAHFITDESSIRHLSLRGNNIADVGCRALGQALKLNRSLYTLNLWSNRIGKEGVDSLAEVLSNYALLNDELASRRKIIAELDRQRKDAAEEDSSGKKGFRNIRMNTPGNQLRRGSGNKGKEEEKSKDSAADAKGAKKTGKTGAVAPPAKANANAANPSTDNAQAKGKTGASGANPSNTAANAGAAADDKKSKDKKGAAAANVKGKKGKAEEVKEEVEEAPKEQVDLGPIEPMFENNGTWFTLGNRTLNNLNLSGCNLTEHGLKILYDTVQEQELSVECAPEAGLGLIRISVKENNFDKDHPTSILLQNLLNSRNPFLEQDYTLPLDDKAAEYQEELDGGNADEE